MPRDAVYPSGDDVSEIEQYNQEQMKESQDSATTAALGYLRMDEGDVDVKLRLEDVGGPSAGLLFSLGIVDKLGGQGGDLTGGRVVAGTGTITRRRQGRRRRRGAAQDAGRPAGRGHRLPGAERGVLATRGPNCPTGCGWSR
ncbi:hypothetical protein STENM223S_05738 [Streptomyces tendae]